MRRKRGRKWTYYNAASFVSPSLSSATARIIYFLRHRSFAPPSYVRQRRRLRPTMSRYDTYKKETRTERDLLQRSVIRVAVSLLRHLPPALICLSRRRSFAPPSYVRQRRRLRAIMSRYDIYEKETRTKMDLQRGVLRVAVGLSPPPPPAFVSFVATPLRPRPRCVSAAASVLP